MSHIFICQVREKRAVLKHTIGSIQKKLSFHFWRALVHLSLKLQQQDIYSTPPKKKTQQDGELHVFTFTVLFFLFPCRDQKDKTFLSKLVAL